MSILLIAEHNNKEIKPFTLNAISAASQINDDVHVLVIGSNSDEVAKSLSEVNSVMAKAVKKGILKKQYMSRKLSSLSNLIKKN